MVIMKKILIEKTKDQKKKRKSLGEGKLIWKIIAVSTAVCIVCIGAFGYGLRNAFGGT